MRNILLTLWVVVATAVCFAEIDVVPIQVTNIGTNGITNTNDSDAAVNGEVYGIHFVYTGTNTYTNTVTVSTIANTNLPAITIIATNHSNNATYYPVVAAHLGVAGTNAPMGYKPLKIANQKVRVTASSTNSAAVTTNSHLRVSIVFERQ